MAQIRLARRAQADLDRLFEFLVDRRHPRGDRRKSPCTVLPISRGKSGYVALYRHLERRDLVRVLAIRHQREAGYQD